MVTTFVTLPSPTSSILATVGTASSATSTSPCLPLLEMAERLQEGERVLKHPLSGVIICKVSLCGRKIGHHGSLRNHTCLACLKSRVPDATDEQLAPHLLGEAGKSGQILGRHVVVGTLCDLWK